jgi:FkbM family methyltransferase
MNLTYPLNPELLAEFTRWYKINQDGGWDCTWRRRSVWGAQLIQKLGLYQEVSVPLFFGEKMRIVTGETVSKSLLAFGYSEITITALMLCLLRPGQTFVDIGAHFGYEALLASKLVGIDGSVTSFEPSPSSYSIAYENLRLFQNTKLFQLAIGASTGKLKLEKRAIGESAFNRVTIDPTVNCYDEVSVTTLDIFLENRTKPVNFLKCDVEGFEIDVLEGAHKLLTVDSPILVLEADMPSEDGQVSSKALELASFLESYNYKALSFDFDGSLRLGELNSFPIYHANIAFIPRTRVDILNHYQV